MAVRVVTDSTCDLPADLAAELGIVVVPLNVYFGEEEFLDGVEITSDEFYERLVASPELPKTSQPRVEAFREAYESTAEETEEIVSIHVSSKLSGTLNSASIAREQVSHALRIEVIDSYNVSVGLGMIAMEAARAANAGASMPEVVRAARSAMDRVWWVAFLDTLQYLHKGGRIGRARSLVGSLLSIKPLLHCEDGEVAPFERIRTRNRVVERLFEVATDDLAVGMVFVAGGVNRDEVEDFRERLEPMMPHTEFHSAQFGPAVGVYTGPTALGVGGLSR